MAAASTPATCVPAEKSHNPNRSAGRDKGLCGVVVLTASMQVNHRSGTRRQIHRCSYRGARCRQPSCYFIMILGTKLCT